MMPNSLENRIVTENLKEFSFLFQKYINRYTDIYEHTTI